MMNMAATFDESGVGLLPEWVDAALRGQLVATGYGNAFEAIRADVPWRPEPIARPAVPGPLLATVVGADGSSRPGAGRPEIHTDRLGRIRIRHEFQAEGEGSTWVRVVQPLAGPGMGLQFIPRIGQQVLVGFFDDDIDRPFVQGALYTGRGEGGVPATPGGRPGQGWGHSDPRVFSHSTDHRPAGQGNLTGGNAPPWHGAGFADITAGGQANRAALSGWKTQEFAGESAANGFNQLVFDDTTQQLRAQLATTQHATQLNLGHLVHQADNHRGSFRGLGFELRTDAYGTLRGQQGVLLSTFGTQPHEPAGDNAAGIALAGQLKTLAQTFSEAARTHQTVQLASHIGSTRRGQSALSEQQAPAAALHTALKGMVSADSLEAALGDAARKAVATAKNTLPHTSDPLVAISAKAGLAVAAGQDVVMSAGETILLGAGQDANWATDGRMRVHSGQAIGVLGGAVGAVGAGSQASGTGLSLIAGHGAVELQAQADQLQIAAKDDVSIQSRSAHIDWAAARKIVLQVKGGASITIEGGGITLQCPGTITVRAGTKSFVGPERVTYAFPPMPRVPLPATTPFKFDLRLSDAAGPLGAGLPNSPWRIVIARDERLARTTPETLLSGRSSSDGKLQLGAADEATLRQAGEQHPGQIWLVQRGKTRPLWLTPERQDWTDGQRQDHAHDAIGYTDTLGASGDAHADRAIARLGRDETGARSGSAILSTLKT